MSRATQFVVREVDGGWIVCSEPFWFSIGNSALEMLGYKGRFPLPKDEAEKVLKLLVKYREQPEAVKPRRRTKS